MEQKKLRKFLARIRRLRARNGQETGMIPAGLRRIAQKIEWHYTPEHGSWLNIAECELSVLARQCLSRRIPDIKALTQEAAAWEGKRNALQVRIDWQFTTEEARIKLKRLYPELKPMFST